METSQIRSGATRPGLHSKKAALSERAQQVLAAGGQVWIGDESTLREFPPLRAAWSRKGIQRLVEISGRNSRRVIHAALNVQTGQLVRVLRERHRQEDAIAFIEALGKLAPSVPKLLIWDNGPPHHPKRVLQAAADHNIEIRFLPFRSPELNPCEDLWRGLKGEIAANRTYASMEELGERALVWLDAPSPADVLRRSGLLSSKFNWLAT